MIKPVSAKAQWLLALLAALLLVTGARAAGDRTVHLTVQVTDEEGKPISMARVNVYSEYIARSKYLAAPPDLQYDTNVNGLAPFQIPVKAGERFQIRIEVGREDKQTESRELDKGADFPERLLEKFSLKARSAVGKGPVINVAIDVKSAEGPIEGASVVIWDTSLGTATGRFPGVTGGDGRVTIPVLYGSADSEEKLPVEVSKGGYKNNKIFININKKQIGKTVEGGTATLEKAAADAAKVTVTVINKKNKQGVGDATVILDGAGSAYHSDTTNTGGNVTFYVSKTGTFKVRISQDNYLPFTGETRLLQGEQEKPLTFELEPKAIKDQGEDTIEVTVLGKDSTDEKSKPSPVKGAYVKAGTISATSDDNGIAVLTGAFEERQEVRVEADGYKGKNATVGVSKILHMSAGSGKIRVTLDPELSDKSPIRLRVEVRDSAGKAVPKAKVDISTAAGEYLTGTFTDDAGNFNFDSSEFEQDLSVLRKGLLVNVKAKNYKEVLNRSVPADLLKPSTETRQFIVQLDKGWDALLEAINALEPRVLAWNNELTLLNHAAQNIAKFKADVTQLGQKAAAISDEIDEARKAFTGVDGQSSASMRCEGAERLKTNIEGYSKEAAAKEKELDQALEKAKATAATCSQASHADEIKKLYEQAIKLTGAIGVLEKKAAKDGSDLKDTAKRQGEFKQIAAKVETKINELAQHATEAEGLAASAGKSIVSAQKLNASLKAGHTTLTGELANLKKTHGFDKPVEPIPDELLKRVETMGQLLSKKSSDAFASPNLDSVKSIQETAAEIKNKKEKAESLLAGYKRDKKGSCDIEPMDNIVEAIGTIVTNSSFDLGLAATLADDCAKKIANAANQVEVPDLSALNDLGAMTRAADQAGMVLRPAATSATPPSGSQRLFGPQSPLAKSKANRGDPLIIPVYQKLAEKAASPPAVVSDSPKPNAADEYVDVPSVATAKDAGAMSKMLEAAGFKAVFNAATPKKKEDELKYAGQDPVGRVKKSEMQQRGNQVIVLINQSWQPQTAQATPTPQETKLGTMPNLIGLTLEQAASRLTGKMRIGGDEIGNKPPSPEKALTVYAQNPLPSSKIDIAKEVVVTVKRYGSAQAAATPFPAPRAPATVEKFDGSYSGSYSGDSSGDVRFSIADGAISIRSPGSGSGTVSSSGSANFSGAGTDTGASYTFSGRFTVSAGGKASASGTWRARSEYGNYSGNWRASR